MKLTINSNAIKHDTGKASLIKLPKEERFFWLSNKCVYGNGWKITIYVNPDYTYYGKEKKTKTEFDGEEIINAFDGSEVSVATSLDYEHHKPEKKEAVSIDVDDELKR